MLLTDDQDVLANLKTDVEHLGWATIGRLDVLLGVVESSPRSIETVGRIRRLAVERVRVIVNRVVAPHWCEAGP